MKVISPQLNFAGNLDDLNQSGIYQIRNILNDKIYIGRTKNFKERKRAHSRCLFQSKHSSYKLQQAYNKYGIDNFIFEILEICSEDKLIELEQYYLDLKCAYSRNNYNVCDDSTGGSTLEMRIKQSRTKINKKLLLKRDQKELNEIAKQQLNLSQIPKGAKVLDAGKLVFLVDDCLFDDINKYNWFTRITNKKEILCVREKTIEESKKLPKVIKLHSYLLNFPKRKIIKFNNGNKQDCRRSNLFIVPTPTKDEIKRRASERIKLKCVFEIFIENKPLYIGTCPKNDINRQIKIINKRVQFPYIIDQLSIRSLFESQDINACKQKAREIVLEIGIDNLLNKLIPGDPISRAKGASEKISAYAKAKAAMVDVNGENNPSCKFTNNDILAMREMYKNGTNVKDIIKLYNINRQYLMDILNNKKRNNI